MIELIQEILNFISLSVLFFLFWILGAIGHELFHGLACVLQGCKFKIKVWWFELGKIKLPSMSCAPEGTLRDDSTYLYLGGIGIGSAYILTSLVFYFIWMPLFIVLFLIGIANFSYGIYEGVSFRKIDFDEFMRIHYLVYLVSIGIGIILIRKELMDVVLNWKLI